MQRTGPAMKNNSYYIRLSFVVMGTFLAGIIGHLSLAAVPIRWPMRLQDVQVNAALYHGKYGMVIGIIEDLCGAPIEGAEVHISLFDPITHPNGSKIAITNFYGEFCLDELVPCDNYYLTVEDRNHYYANYSCIIVIGGAALWMEIPLVPAHSSVKVVEIAPIGPGAANEESSKEFVVMGKATDQCGGTPRSGWLVVQSISNHRSWGCSWSNNGQFYMKVPCEEGESRMKLLGPSDDTAPIVLPQALCGMQVGVEVILRSFPITWNAPVSFFGLGQNLPPNVKYLPCGEKCDSRCMN